ncbi:hypothetical protein [Bradyrhizobium sp. OK095]|uniref:hypothetical protein n=1 Tax=Bradyrhizobium sp. OK095 TaxID=1882760 RepID=UPI0008BA2E50|nr:hypothetical protein [Bradyrhizobium sp. OK095]SEN25152.1 hypothetical protein SAMN05443254_10711 [Bradyrhizobium sp. OK095]
MKILKSAAPVLLSTLNVGDLFYVIKGSALVLALRLEEYDNEHPYLTYLEGSSAFELESAEHLLDSFVIPADLECRLVGSPKVAGSIQDVPPGSVSFGNGTAGIVVRTRKWKMLFDLETGKGVAATTPSFAFYEAWKLVRVTEKPKDQVVEAVFEKGSPG